MGISDFFKKKKVSSSKQTKDEFEELHEKTNNDLNKLSAQINEFSKQLSRKNDHREQIETTDRVFDDIYGRMIQLENARAIKTSQIVSEEAQKLFKELELRRKMPEQIESKITNPEKNKIITEETPKTRINSILDKIPQNFKNRDYYIGVAKFFGLEYIPKDEINDNMYLEAVKTHGLEIRNIPNDKITKEIALAAIKNDHRAFNFLPSKFYNQDFYLEAAKINGHIVSIIPEKERTKTIILEGIKSNGYLINYLPQEERTLDLYKEAIKTHGPAIYQIPKEDITPEMYLDAIKTQAYIVKDYLPRNMKNPEIYKQIVKINGLAIEYIPDITSEMYLDAVKSNGLALKYIPDKVQTTEIYLEAAKNNGIWYIPKEARTKEIWIEALKKDGYNICSMPDEIMTPEFIIELFKSLDIIKEEVNNYSFKYDGQPRENMEITKSSDYKR